jgi:hypothetical protein
MTKRCWIQTIILPVSFAVLAASAEAQGQGKGQGQAKPQKQEQVARKAEKQSSAPAVGKAHEMSQKAEKQNAGQVRAEENHVAHAATRHDEFKDNSPKKGLPASENASPRAIVASDANHGRAVGRFDRDLHQSEVRPVVQRFVISNRPAEYVIGGATSYAFARGIPENMLVIMPSGRDVWIRNKRANS